MKIAVYGARGFQGRLVQAELRRRDFEVVALGRAQALATDHDALVAAFTGCDAVINCAGPFLVSGLGPVRAAVAAGVPYVDTSGEQPHVRAVLDAVPSNAVPVMPAATDAGVPTDLLAHLLGPQDHLVFTHVIEGGGGASRGSLRSIAGIAHLAANGRHSRVRLPGADADTATVEFPLIEAVTVPRHVRVGRIDGFVEAAVGAALGTPLPAEVINTLPEGPAEKDRAGQRFTYLIEADREVGVIQGFDTYGTTAVIAVEAARRLVSSGERGALAPAQAFDPADFLGFLAGAGVSFSRIPRPATPRSAPC